MGLALLFLVLLIAASLWAAYRVSRSRLPLSGVQASPSPALPPSGIPIAPPPPGQVHCPGLEPFEIAAAFFEDTEAPILDFAALDDWAGQATDPEALREARRAGRRAWLLHLRHWMGPQATLMETEEYWVLSYYPANMARAAGNYVAACRRRISELLDGLAEFPADERSTLIVLDVEETYYHYVANYYPEEGEFAFSGGMFINAGCPHFVAMHSDLWQLEPVIAHEMTHFALAHLSLPLWLDEGLAVNTEHRISTSQRHPQAALEALARHHGFWNAETIQEFWSGKSFQRGDEGNELSYDLARAMVDLIGRDWPAFVRFARVARREDGGAAAARSQLSLDLGELAAAAINWKLPVSWSPKPDEWHGVAIKARRGSGR